jgi:molybdopterin/thiamine biosynthesis adenylyltransferase
VTWYISDLVRFRSERRALDALPLAEEWLANSGWRIDERVRLVLDCEISAGGRQWPVFLQYPDLFPHTPPSVFPRGDASRWSAHQFGPGGELCLEYGPDNWVPEFTGADLIRSAHRLLSGENPAPGIADVVPSRHRDTVGQRFRGRRSRLLLTRHAERFLSDIPLLATCRLTFLTALHDETVVHSLQKGALADGTNWSNSDIPAEFASETSDRPADLIRLPADDPPFPTKTAKLLRAALLARGLDAQQRYVMVLQGTTVNAFLLSDKDDTVLEIAVIRAQPAAQRLPSSHEALATKYAALIGCGSLGSKLGSMLARAGVGRFLLVDDDLLLPDNFVRHDLDWRDAGTHKSQAVARRIRLVNPSAEARSWRIRVAAQEANESADTLLGEIGACDLIIDATANPDVLNLVSAAAAAAVKPVIWAEVFGGGIGGLIARSRPGIEPSPQYMRWAIENWFADKGATPVRSRRSYETGEDGAPLVADDADIAVIAAHATHLAIDILLGRAPSEFNDSVYAIGLKTGSVFSGPFDTYPIKVGTPPTTPAVAVLSPEETSAEIAKVVDLIASRRHETPAAIDDAETPPT